MLMFYKNNSLLSISSPLKESISLNNLVKLPEDTKLDDLTIDQITKKSDFVLTDKTGKPTRIVSYGKLIETLFNNYRQLEQLYNALLQAVDDAITIVDKHGTVIGWNKKSEQLYETDAKKIINQPITDFFKEEALMLMTTLREGKKVVRKYNQPRDGLHVLINTVPIYFDNNLIGGISVEREMTEIVKLHNELSTTSAYIYDLENIIATTQNDDPFHKIKGRSKPLTNAIDLAKKVAVTDATVIITGESGVGKELFAQAIHKTSPRANKPFIGLNCGAIPAALFESELFGYEKGAFTGAVKEGKIGKIDAAKGGTLFLDEIAELPLELQVKLLRVLQEKHFYRVGGTTPIPFDARIISATNKSLADMVAEGSFREDLFYRLNVVSVNVPPLRERIEDIAELVQLFIHEFSIKYKKPITEVDPEVMLAFMHNPWNGNIRQLKNTIERMVILADDDVLDPKYLPAEFSLINKQNVVHHSPLEQKHFLEIDDEKTRIIAALKKTYGNKTAAAKLLGISRVTLYNKLDRYNIK